MNAQAEMLVDTPTRMAEVHTPKRDPKQCEFGGACGAPMVRCPLHQAVVPCMLEIPGACYERLKPGFAEHINSPGTGEKVLEVLRWRWTNGCAKERPGISEDAALVKARIETITHPSVNRALKLLGDVGVTS